LCLQIVRHVGPSRPRASVRRARPLRLSIPVITVLQDQGISDTLRQGQPPSGLRVSATLPRGSDSGSRFSTTQFSGLKRNRAAPHGVLWRL
jgi:hypothetical protein